MGAGGGAALAGRCAQPAVRAARVQGVPRVDVGSLEEVISQVSLRGGGGRAPHACASYAQSSSALRCSCADPGMPPPSACHPRSMHCLLGWAAARRWRRMTRGTGVTSSSSHLARWRARRRRGQRQPARGARSEGSPPRLARAAPSLVVLWLRQPLSRPRAARLDSAHVKGGSRSVCCRRLGANSLQREGFISSSTAVQYAGFMAVVRVKGGGGQ